jgi:hypothetical protein
LKILKLNVPPGFFVGGSRRFTVYKAVSEIQYGRNTLALLGSDQICRTEAQHEDECHDTHCPAEASW